MSLACATLSIRHEAVKLFAPKLYDQAFSYKRRPMLRLLSESKLPLVGAEIGVRLGLNAEWMLKNMNIKKLFLVDPYEPYYESTKIVYVNINIMKIAKKRLARFNDKTQFIIMRSSDAHKYVPNNLDFVYIDGCHTYQQVKEDIENYFPKVKVGGLIGGHDFFGDYCGLVRAVVEFSASKKLELHGEETDWWFKKER